MAGGGRFFIGGLMLLAANAATAEECWLATNFEEWRAATHSDAWVETSFLPETVETICIDGDAVTMAWSSPAASFTKEAFRDGAFFVVPSDRNDTRTTYVIDVEHRRMVVSSITAWDGWGVAAVTKADIFPMPPEPRR